MIEVKNLVKKYGSHLAVDHLNFTVDTGQIYGFLGPNGAGKSTTMNIMTGYLGATEGEVLINGHNILEEPEAAPGKYGLLRLRYLEKSDPDQLNILLLEGALNSHLAQIDRQVRGQVEQTMERLVQRTKLPDKQTDPLGWAGTMNSLRQQAEETAMELIYGS